MWYAFIKYSDLRGSRYLSKRNGTEIIECSGDAGSGEKRCWRLRRVLKERGAVHGDSYTLFEMDGVRVCAGSFWSICAIERWGWKKWCLWMEDFAGQDCSMVFSRDIWNGICCREKFGQINRKIWGKNMETESRVAVIGIVVDQTGDTEELNKVLHQ